MFKLLANSEVDSRFTPSELGSGCSRREKGLVGYQRLLFIYVSKNAQAEVSTIWKDSSLTGKHQYKSKDELFTNLEAVLILITNLFWNVRNIKMKVHKNKGDRCKGRSRVVVEGNYCRLPCVS